MPADQALIRVLVVDDSATMRSLIVRALQADPGLVVVGQASCPQEAQAAIKALNPNVITLDIEMPQMNGLDFLERLMRLRPLPVVMVSNLTSRGAVATLRALELGAVECVAKPLPGAPSPDDAGFTRLPEIVRAAATARLRPSRQVARPRARAGSSPPPPSSPPPSSQATTCWRSARPPAGSRRCWRSCPRSRPTARRP